MLSFFLRLSRAKLLFVAAMMILIVALIDWRVELNVSFGFLYLFPMLIVGSCLARWQLAILGGLCTFLAELFSPFTWDLAAGVPRDIFMFAAYFGTALFAHESAKNRRLTVQHVREVEQEALLRRDAEQQLQAHPLALVHSLLTLQGEVIAILADGDVASNPGPAPNHVSEEKHQGLSASRAHRTPSPLLLALGMPLSRPETRASPGSLTQDPPRTTRS